MKRGFYTTMITQLSGLLTEKYPPQITIDVHGVAYELDVSMQTFYQLPDCGQPVVLKTHLSIREDAHVLFGFMTREERTIFRQLIKVSGVGPKTALGILSSLSHQELAATIDEGNIKRLSAAPGIGKKTAERLILELRGKINPAILPLFAEPSVASAHDDILSALLALGYNDKEAKAAMKPLPNDVSINDGIRLSLKQLM
jgi:Holliday junction DNA helicase RuvA